jgi:hypothetical protein
MCSLDSALVLLFQRITAMYCTWHLRSKLVCFLVPKKKSIINAQIAGLAKRRLLLSILIPLRKPGTGNGIRPICTVEAFFKLATQYIMAVLKPCLPEIFPSIQLGVGVPGGPEVAAGVLKGGIEFVDPQSIIIGVDVSNAFNTRRRSEIAQILFDNPLSAPAYRLFHWAYSQVSDLVVLSPAAEAPVMLQSAEGVRQGDALSSFAFALSEQPKYQAAVAGLPNAWYGDLG